ncbi:unnamed protein product, partial [marine sediment metagenome]
LTLKKKIDLKADWKYCTKCEENKVAPWNKSGICSSCQQERKKPKDEEK